MNKDKPLRNNQIQEVPESYHKYLFEYPTLRILVFRFFQYTPVYWPFEMRELEGGSGQWRTPVAWPMKWHLDDAQAPKGPIVLQLNLMGYRRFIFPR